MADATTEGRGRIPRGRSRTVLAVLVVLDLLMAAFLIIHGGGNSALTLDLDTMEGNAQTINFQHSDAQDESATGTVPLSIGQTFRIVAGSQGDYTWRITSGDPTQVLRRTGTATLPTCSSHPVQAGCSEAQQTTFVASARGTATVVYVLGPSPTYCASAPPATTDCFTATVHIVVR